MAEHIYIGVGWPYANGSLHLGHLAGAYNINFDSIGQHIHTITADKDAPIVLYCKSGRRSGLAKETLEQMGYSNVTNAGGVNDVLREARSAAVTGAECRPADC